MSAEKPPSSPASGAGTCPSGGATVPCPLCRVTAVELKVTKDKLTLKHDRENTLKIEVTGTNFTVDEYRIEIKRASGGPWCVLKRVQTLDPWNAIVAGKFKLRGVVKACGSEHTSPEKDVEVQFPTYAEIVGDSTVSTDVGTEWSNTLADCTATPNRRREKGFWIRLNTKTNTYEHTAVVNGTWNAPADGAGVDIGSRPADAPATPDPCSEDGATYSVASFHTHTPTEFRAAATPPGSTRPIGPSGADNTIDTSDDVPGVVYDFVESPAGSGSIPMGHPKTSAAQLYHSRGKDRRTTPP
jgi:hypothetical protein